MLNGYELKWACKSVEIQLVKIVLKIEKNIPRHLLL
jgi:hypothetical protein